MKCAAILSLLLGLISNTWAALKIHYAPIDGDSDKLPIRERFYLVHKGTLLLDTSLNDYKKWEPKIGPVKKAGSGPIRKVSLQKVPELDFKTGDEIAFFRDDLGLVEHYKVKDDIHLMLNPDGCSSDQFYNRVNLIAVDPPPRKFDENDNLQFSSVAFRGKTYKLKNAKPTKANEVTSKDFVGDLEVLVKEFAHEAKATPSEINVLELLNGEKRTFFLSSSKTKKRSHFVKVSNGEYIRWDEPTGIDDKKSILLSGDFIEGAELTLLYQHSNVVYVVLLTRGKVYRYPALTSYPFKGC